MKKQNKLSSAEKWRRLTFVDNYIFCKVMEESPAICKKMIEMLLGITIEKIEFPQAERTIKYGWDSKGIRLDVYVRDSAGRTFDVEVQTSTAKNLALAKRARYYQSLIDVDSVFSGGKYSGLKETYVIFLCLGDAFGAELPVYTFENMCRENLKIRMGDGTCKIFFNARMYDTMKSEELRAELARKEAREEKAVETARNFLDLGVSPEQVSKGTGLSLEQVLEIQKESKLVKA